MDAVVTGRLIIIIKLHIHKTNATIENSLSHINSAITIKKETQIGTSITARGSAIKEMLNANIIIPNSLPNLSINLVFREFI